MKEDAVCPHRVTAHVLSPHSSCLAQSRSVHHLYPGLNVLHPKSKKVDLSNFGSQSKSQGWEETSLPELRQCKEGILWSSWKEGKNLTKGKQQTDGGTKK